MKIKKFPLFSIVLLLSLLVVSMIVIQSVGAVEYQWLDNEGFEDSSTALILDGTFESNTWVSSGVGGWNRSSTTPVFSTTNPHAGTYCIYGYMGNPYGIMQTLTTPTKGSEIAQLSVWIKANTYSYYSMSCVIYYNDTTNTLVYITGVNVTYAFKDLTSSINSAKFVSAIKFATDGEHTPMIDTYIDDVVLTKGAGAGQTEISTTSTPWWGLENNRAFIDNTVSRTGQISCKVNSSAWVLQEINFLASDNGTTFWCYAKTDETANYAQVAGYLFYTDGTWSMHEFEINNATSYNWVLLNFTGYKLAGRVINRVGFCINMQDDLWSGKSVWIDDTSLFANVAVTTSSFSWQMSPTPIEYVFNFGARCLQHTPYSFLGQVNDINGNPTETGTFSVTHSKGSNSGTIINGVFNFPIIARESVGNFSESFYVSINVPSKNFTATISIEWIYVGYGTDSGGGISGGGTIPNTNVPISTLATLILMLFLLFVPSFLLAWVAGKAGINPILGFLAGFNVMSLIGVVSHLLDFWIYFGVIILDIVLGLYTFEKSRTSGIG